MPRRIETDQHGRFGRNHMAKGQKRNGREQKKPKQGKAAVAVARSALAALHDRPATPVPTKKA